MTIIYPIVASASASGQSATAETIKPPLIASPSAGDSIGTVFKILTPECRSLYTASASETAVKFTTDVAGNNVVFTASSLDSNEVVADSSLSDFDDGDIYLWAKQRNFIGDWSGWSEPVLVHYTRSYSATHWRLVTKDTASMESSRLLLSEIEFKDETGLDVGTKPGVIFGGSGSWTSPDSAFDNYTGVSSGHYAESDVVDGNWVGQQLSEATSIKSVSIYIASTSYKPCNFDFEVSLDGGSTWSFVSEIPSLNESETGWHSYTVQN